MNNSFAEQKMGSRPLRFLHPDCYRLLMERLDEYHLHPFDLKAEAVWQEDGLLILLRYGEGLSCESVRLFSHHTVEQLGQELTLFFRETAEACKEVMIADYFKLMKP